MSVHPAIIGLVREAFYSGVPLTATRKAKIVAAMEALLDFLYEDV